MFKVLFHFILLFNTLWITEGVVFRLGALYSDPIDDFAYNFRLEVARSYVARQLFQRGIDVESEIHQSLPANDTTLQVLRTMAEAKFDLIMITSNFYFSQAIDFIQEYPDIPVLGLGLPPAPKVTNILPKTWQGYYIAGRTCALVTNTKKVGFIGINVNELSWANQNAFYLGVKSVDTSIEAYITFTDSYYDPLMESKVATWMVETLNVDCGTSQSVDAAKSWTSRDSKVVGFISDMRYLVNENVLLSVLFDWTTSYLEVADTVVNNTYVGRPVVYKGFESLLQLADFSTLTEASVQRDIISKISAIVNGTEGIFCGNDVAPFNPSGPNGCFTQDEIVNFKHALAGINNPRNWTHSDVITNIIADYDSPLSISILVITSFCALLALLLFVHVGVYFNSVTIKAASPVFLWMIIGGCWLALSSTYFWLGSPTVHLCNGKYNTLFLLFSTVFLLTAFFFFNSPYLVGWFRIQRCVRWINRQEFPNLEIVPKYFPQHIQN